LWTRFRPGFSTVTLGDSLNLVLLLHGVRVDTGAGALGGGKDFFSEDLAHALDVSESGLSGTAGDQVDGLVHSAEGGNVDSLSADDTTGTDSGRVFTSTTIGNSVDKDLEGVLTGLKVNKLKSLLHDSDCHLLLAGVATLHHEGVSEALNDGAVHFLETSLLVSASCERKEDLGLNGLHVKVGQE
jgi:hypothetical protein